MPLLSDIVLEVLIRTVRQEKEKAFRLVRKKTIFTYHMILYVENSKESTIRRSEFSKQLVLCGTQNQYTKTRRLNIVKMVTCPQIDL